MMTKITNDETLKFSLLMFALLAGIAFAACPSGMVSYWRFDEGSGTTMSDFTNLNPGTLVNPTWITGKIGSAVDFGSGDNGRYFRIPNSASLNPTNEATMVVWFKNNGGGGILTKDGDFEGKTRQWEFLRGVNWAFSPTYTAWLSIFWTTQSNGYFYLWTKLPNGFNYNDWNFYSVTYDGSYLKTYLNGAPGNSTYLPGQLLTGTADIRSSIRPDGYQDNGGGMYDEFAFFNLALTDVEIEKLYTTTKTGTAGYCDGGAPEPTCTDAMQNQGESDEDCGGPCSGCANGKHCSVNNDCSSNNCQGGLCTAQNPNLIQNYTGGTVENQGITVTIPAGALGTTELLVNIVESEHSFAPVAGTDIVGQPLDIGPQCVDITSQSICVATNGCRWSSGSCSFIPFISPVTITMPGDCSGNYGDLTSQRISKYNYATSNWDPVSTCEPEYSGEGMIFSCQETDGRTMTWDMDTCKMSVQTWSFSTYSVVTGYRVQYCSTQFISQEGTWVVNYDVTDTYGNRATGASQQIKVDLYPPSALAQLTGVVGGSGWYISDVVVDFVSSDSMSGVKAVYYSLDNVIWNEWAGQDTLALSESSKLYYYAKDRAGHTSDVQSINVYIEKTAPTVSIEESGTSGAEPWWMSALGLSITATDTESGVKTICYTIGGVEECVQSQ